MALISVSNNALSGITALPASIPTGALTLIKSITASASASISFVDGTDGVVLDGTYSSYVFSFNNMHPETDNTNLTFNMSTDSGSNWNVTKTTTAFYSVHLESDAGQELDYLTARDLAQSTSDQQIMFDMGNDADQSWSGSLQIFSPSSTVFVKHFIARTIGSVATDRATDFYIAGYGNTVSAVNGIIFRMSSGNIDDGIIKLYGVS